MPWTKQKQKPPLFYQRVRKQVCITENVRQRVETEAVGRPAETLLRRTKAGSDSRSLKTIKAKWQDILDPKGWQVRLALQPIRMDDRWKRWRKNGRKHQRASIYSSRTFPTRLHYILKKKSNLLGTSSPWGVLTNVYIFGRDGPLHGRPTCIASLLRCKIRHQFN